MSSDSLGLLMSWIRSRMPSMMTSPMFCSSCSAQRMDVPALVGRVLAQHEELDPVVLPVCRQPRQLEYPVQYLVAVAFALFRVNVQHAVLAGRQLRLVFQHLFPRQGRGHDGADIERFLAFGLSGRCAEIAQRRHGHAVYLHDLLRKVVLFGDIQTNVLQ